MIGIAHVSIGYAATTPAACGKDTMTFGCNAYIYGDTNSAGSYAGRADTVAVDAQEMAKNPALAQRLNQNGPFPLFYTNAFCERRFGSGCPGPYLRSSDVSRNYSEQIQDPNSAAFFQNFQMQLAWVKQVQGKVIEIDNMDEYIRQGHKGAIVKLIQLAANSGINVLAKNVRDADILRIPNVVGAVVEAGSGNAADYHAAFQSVGKPCAGVLMINARSTAGNQYTSHTQCDHPARGNRSEYTKCSCTKNPAGMQIAGTPVAGQNVDIPAAALQQAYNSPPQSNPFTQQQSQPTGVTSGQPGGGQSTPQQTPQQYQPQPQFTQIPPTNLNQQPTSVKDKASTDTAEKEKRETLAFEKAPKDKGTSEGREGEETEFYDPLGGKKNASKNPPAQDKLLPRPFGDARMRCMPTAIRAGARPTIAWSCGKRATSGTGIGFDTRNYLLGSTRVKPQRTTLYAVKCYEEGVLIGSAQCIIRVQTEKSADESFSTKPVSTTGNERQRSLCFLTFCI